MTATFAMLAGALLWPGGDLSSQDLTTSIKADFSTGWAERWQDVRLAGRANRFTVVDSDGSPTLMAVSERSASALWHAIDLSPEDGDIIVWRWKVERSLLENRKEREKRGDDYSARLFVIFDGEPFSREARAVCYVWASNEPVGSVYRSPFFSNVVTVVLESGTERVGEWVPEARHFVQDYRAAFGANPRTVTAVAVMVDTDNTGGRAVTWFDGIGVRRNAIEAAVGRDSAPRH